MKHNIIHFSMIVLLAGIAALSSVPAQAQTEQTRQVTVTQDMAQVGLAYGQNGASLSSTRITRKHRVRMGENTKCWLPLSSWLPSPGRVTGETGCEQERGIGVPLHRAHRPQEEPDRDVQFQGG